MIKDQSNIIGEIINASQQHYLVEIIILKCKQYNYECSTENSNF